MIADILPYIQVVLSILLVIGVLLQRSEESLGAAFGSDSGSNGRFMRRGFEKLLFTATVILAILFVISAFASLILAR